MHGTTTLLMALLMALPAFRPSSVMAQAVAPKAGPVIESAGAVFTIDDPDVATPVDHTFRAVFEVVDAADDPDQLNISLNTAARFLNMHAPAAEFMYHQSRANALPPIVWARWEATLAWWLSHPGMRAWWASKPTPLAEDFEAFGSNLIRDYRPDPSVVQRWSAFIAGDGMPGATVPASTPSSSRHETGSHG